jgi:hypothetical protein
VGNGSQETGMDLSINITTPVVNIYQTDLTPVLDRLASLEMRFVELASLVASLVDEGSDREAAKALAVEITARARTLRDAIPST